MIINNQASANEILKVKHHADEIRTRKHKQQVKAYWHEAEFLGALVSILLFIVHLL